LGSGEGRQDTAKATLRNPGCEAILQLQAH
jgi:hypothetical protein